MKKTITQKDRVQQLEDNLFEYEEKYSETKDLKYITKINATQEQINKILTANK